MIERKYKVGDVVRTLVDIDVYGNKLFPKGTIGIITEISDCYEDSLYPYKVDANEDWWYYNADMIEPVYDDETPKQEPCKDTISRKAAIDAFSMFAEYESNRTNAEWVDRISVVLSSLPPVQPISRWIPVSERLPEEDAKVLTTIKWKDGSRYVGIDSIVGDKWMLNIPEDGDTTIAWMPLPPSYQGE